MHFLVSALGSAGDVHPFIAIGQALQSRGHEVQIIALAPFEQRIARAGLAFTPLGTFDDYQRLVQQPALWHPLGGARLLIDDLLQRLPEAHALTASLVRAGQTVLVGSSLSWGARLAQEQFGLPGATVHLAPFALQSATAPSVLPGGLDLSRLPAGLVRALYRSTERFVLDPRIAPPLNRLRSQLNLPPVQRVLSRWMHSPDLVIGAWPAWFAPPQADWPQPMIATGFPLFDEGGASLDAALLAFLDAGPAPIGITPGSAMAHGRRFFTRALDACLALGRRVVLVSPYREQLPQVLPAEVHHASWAPFSRLMPRLAALIHHGGIGTSAQALTAGIPQLVVPFAHDQFDNAARLERLGVAAVQNESASARGWATALRKLMADSEATLAAHRCAGLMAADDLPAQTIATALENLGRARLAQRAA
jgi:rhamnosyltransferase subunit B